MSLSELLSRHNLLNTFVEDEASKVSTEENSKSKKDGVIGIVDVENQVVEVTTLDIKEQAIKFK